MNMMQAVQSVYKNYFNFKGRSRRSEFWYFQFFVFLIQILFAISLFFLPESMATVFSIIHSLFLLFTLIPSLALLFRRLHDAGKSAWNILWFLLPAVGWIYVLILHCRKSDGPNEWGMAPLSPNQV